MSNRDFKILIKPSLTSALALLLLSSHLLADDDDDSPFVISAAPGISCASLLTQMGSDIEAKPKSGNLLSQLEEGLRDASHRLGVIFRLITGSTEHESLEAEIEEIDAKIDSTQVVFVKVFPDLIKNLRDRLPSDRVNILLNIGRRMLLRELESELPEQIKDSMQSALMDFSSIRISLETGGEVETTVFEQALHKAQLNFDEFVRTRLPQVHQQLSELKQTEHLQWFSIGVGDGPQNKQNEHLGKIASQYSRMKANPNKVLFWSQVRSEVVSLTLEIKDLLPRLRLSLEHEPDLKKILLDQNSNFSDKFLKLIRSYESADSIQQELEVLAEQAHPNEIHQVSQMMATLSQFIALVGMPAKYDGLAEDLQKEKMDLPDDSAFLLSFDIEGAGAAISKELIETLERLIEDKSDSEIESSLESILSRLDPKKARNEMFNRIQEVFDIVFGHGLASFWQTGDEITFAFDSEKNAQDLREIVNDIFRQNKLGSIRASLVHLRTNGNASPIRADYSAMLVDFSEVLQKEIKRLFFETYHETAPAFYVELELPSSRNEVTANIHTYNQHDTKTLEMFTWLYRKQILDRVEIEHPLYSWTSSTEFRVSKETIVD